MKIKKIQIDKVQRQGILESAGDSGLTIEAVNQISDFIETSMNTKLLNIARGLKTEAVKHYGNKFKTSLVEFKKRANKSAMEKIDLFLDHTVSEWKKENQVVLEKSIAAVRDNKIVNGIKSVFEANYFNVPAGKDNIIKQIGKYASKMETIAESKTLKANKAEKVVERLKRFAITEAASRKLTDSQREKLFEMVKHIKARTVREFASKVLSAKKALVGGPRGNYTTESKRKVSIVNESKRTNASGDSLIESSIRVLGR
jgi:hypothetical protein